MNIFEYHPALKVFYRVYCTGSITLIQNGFGVLIQLQFCVTLMTNFLADACTLGRDDVPINQFGFYGSSSLSHSEVGGKIHFLS